MPTPDDKKYDDQSEQFAQELLDNEAADAVTIRQSRAAMKAAGVSDDDLDHAYGRSSSKSYRKGSRT